mmetsp:Transcript_52221/g.124501  ORF Transcript_52221/g.124501 Transcript_52221/m.124501 type:complete len:320 (-) Transcript_52221:148-1107(-)
MAVVPKNTDLPRVILCGLPHCGKTSIVKVVFDKLQPHETMFLDSSLKNETLLVNRSALLTYRVVDFLSAGFSTSSFEDAELTDLHKNCAVVFVLDAQQEPYKDAITAAKRMMELLTARSKEQFNLHVLIHKVDGDKFYNDEMKKDMLQEIRGKMGSDMTENLAAREIKYHLTSIYDHTIFETFSKIIQGVIPRLSILEECIDTLALNSRMEKAFLFDMVSKLFIAEDSQRVFTQAYEICADMIDVVIDVCSIYGEDGKTTNSKTYMHLGQYVLYHKEVEKTLALVCILQEDTFDRRHLIDYNIGVFQEVLKEILATPDS